MTIAVTKNTDPAVSAAIAGMFPPAKVLQLAEGLSVDIRVLNYGQVAKITRLMKPLLTDPRGSMRESMLDNLELFAEATAIAIGWPIDRVLDLPTEAFAQLVAELITVNYHHFGAQIVPKFAEQFGVDLTALMPEAATA